MERLALTATPQGLTFGLLSVHPDRSLITTPIVPTHCQLHVRSMTDLSKDPTHSDQPCSRHLFKSFREFDQLGVNYILVEGTSEAHEGLALMNRLRKAATRTVLRLWTVVYLVLFASLLVPAARAWTNEDHEIFDLVDFLKKAQHGKEQSFYDILGVDKNADVAKINRAFRRKSFDYHPDKNPSEEKRAIFSRLGPVVKILRSPTARERYDFFLKNGVPVWRGTGYLYRRYRPGFLSVTVGLFIFANLVQYFVHWLNYQLALRKINQYKLELATDTKPKQGENARLVENIAQSATRGMASSSEHVDKSTLTKRQRKKLEREEKLRQIEERLISRAEKQAEEEANELPSDPEEARYRQIQTYWANLDPESLPKPSVQRLFATTIFQCVKQKLLSSASTPSVVANADVKRVDNVTKYDSEQSEAPIASRTRSASNASSK
ncbi:hypothetical protein IWQ62_004952 [Dispira parvispora]|uniref:J domain-containing protein n=1 Tax=Dispira parvispora TaxID=1520584 RepID=A0A9W8E1H8_9FUNG|nr:hypothetical protein IWQ62_004952 [Dispira parvispora]